MELVKGVPITEYCDTENLSTKERLDLFIRVCNAVQHAHQKGIIHRDLKPSNVMVTLHDGKPVPKVIDFGIAKATNRELTDKTLFTEYRQFIGTPEYMSPEQAEMSGLDIDTRSDIYSLGVLLYELLTGVTPFDGARLRSAAINEVQRIIREEEPSRPSTRLSELSRAGSPSLEGGGQGVGESPSSADRSSAQYIAKHRRTDPGSLARQLRGDLDWIIMKALEKDRARRYETANGFAMDVQRYLSDEPVTATPPSMGYKLRKLIRRNRGAVSAAAVVFLVLTLGVIGTTSGWVSARVEADRAERELARATEIKRLITEMLESVDPEIAQATDTTLLKGILDDTAARLERGEIEDELIAQELHRVIGLVYRKLGLPVSAKPHLEADLEICTRLRGPEDRQTLGAMNNLALYFKTQEQFTEAEALLSKTRGLMQRVLGPDDEMTLNATENLGMAISAQARYHEAEVLLREVLDSRTRVLGPLDPATLQSMRLLAGILGDLGRVDECVALYEQSNRLIRENLPEEHPQVIWAMSGLAKVRTDQGRYAEAEALYKQALDIGSRVNGEAHPRTLALMRNLAEVHFKQGLFAEAERLAQDTLEKIQAAEGNDQLGAADCLNTLSYACGGQGRFAEAERHARNALDMSRRLVGDDHPTTLRFENTLCGVYNRQGDYAESARIQKRILDVRKRTAGQDHPNTLMTMNNLAIAYVNQGRFDLAEPVARETLEARIRVLGEDHPNTAQSMGILGTVLGQTGRYAEAEPLYLRSIDVYRDKLGARHPETLLQVNRLTWLYRDMGRHSDAEKVNLEVLEIAKSEFGAKHPQTLTYMSSLAWHYTTTGQFAEAEPLYREALEGRREVLGREHPETIRVINNFGRMFLNQGDFERAEPLLKEAFSLIGQHEAPPVWLVNLNRENLIDLYRAQDRREDLMPLLRDQIESHRVLAEKEHPRPWDMHIYARELLISEIEELRDPERALPIAERLWELTRETDGRDRWRYLDTLALARHMTGDTAAAIETQKQAIELAGENADQKMRDRLAEYEATHGEAE